MGRETFEETNGIKSVGITWFWMETDAVCQWIKPHFRKNQGTTSSVLEMISISVPEWDVVSLPLIPIDQIVDREAFSFVWEGCFFLIRQLLEEAVYIWSFPLVYTSLWSGRSCHWLIAHRIHRMVKMHSNPSSDWIGIGWSSDVTESVCHLMRLRARKEILCSKHASLHFQKQLVLQWRRQVGAVEIQDSRYFF